VSVFVDRRVTSVFYDRAPAGIVEAEFGGVLGGEQAALEYREHRIRHPKKGDRPISVAIRIEPLSIRIMRYRTAIVFPGNRLISMLLSLENAARIDESCRCIGH